MEDDGIWEEERPRRNYLPLSFEDPQFVKEKMVLVRSKKKNLKSGEPIILQTATIGQQALVEK
ncbi:hypothetical protein, partial [Xanthovirga aplysinae]|uniref:hypothetical protein n=1 Tax=Xanthovirga aplysinae TaxID=2529853 RepID=UPI001CA465E8